MNLQNKIKKNEEESELIEEEMLEEAIRDNIERNAITIEDINIKLTR